MSSVVNEPSRAAGCHINHAARCEYLFAMLRRSNDGNQRGSLLRSTRPGPLIGGTPLPSFLSATRTTAWCLVLEEGAADRLVSKRPGIPRPAKRSRGRLKNSAGSSSPRSTPLVFQRGHRFSTVACQSTDRNGTGGSKESPIMRYAIIRNGEQYNVSVTEILPGANGTVATCRELPDLMKIGDDHDDALHRMVAAIERRTKYVHQ